MEGVQSDPLEIVKGVPQRSVLGSVSYIYDFNIDNASFHFYADDTIVYWSAPSKQQSVASLQSAFDIIQNMFCVLSLVLNVEKTKCMWFSNCKTSPKTLLFFWLLRWVKLFQYPSTNTWVLLSITLSIWGKKWKKK